MNLESIELNQEHAESQLSEAQATLKKERERSTTSTLASSKHTELLRKLETLKALTDSNRLPREDRCKFIKGAGELVAMVMQLEFELALPREPSKEFNTKINEPGAENKTPNKQIHGERLHATSLDDGRLVVV